MSATRQTTITRSDGSVHTDELAVEEPLEIRIGERSVAITMRTPGHDEDLAVGFLFGERMIGGADDLAAVVVDQTNIVRVDLVAGVNPDTARVQRNFYTTSSCGVCGKSSLEALELTGYARLDSALVVPATVIHRLSDRVREAQAVFSRTGGLHAAALFDVSGTLVELREDVGRHNAVDKLVGSAVRSGQCPLNAHILFLSGRASFELLQKALAAGIPIVCAVGAPSSLAVELAEQYGITLLGFVRDGRFNVYTHGARVDSR